MLTPSQQVILKAAIDADGSLSSIPHTADGAFAIADLFNLDASPAFIVWKTSVTREEILQNGFDWTRLDNLSVGKARIWSEIFVNGIINSARPNVRAGIEAVWVGTAADLAVRAAVYVHCKRLATRAEKLYATGTGLDATPATLTFEGTINYLDVMSSMGW